MTFRAVGSEAWSLFDFPLAFLIVLLRFLQLLLFHEACAEHLQWHRCPRQHPPLDFPPIQACYWRLILLQKIPVPVKTQVSHLFPPSINRSLIHPGMISPHLPWIYQVHPSLPWIPIHCHYRTHQNHQVPHSLHPSEATRLSVFPFSVSVPPYRRVHVEGG
jgi:hypothetical protein